MCRICKQFLTVYIEIKKVEKFVLLKYNNMLFCILQKWENRDHI